MSFYPSSTMQQFLWRKDECNCRCDKIVLLQKNVCFTSAKWNFAILVLHSVTSVTVNGATQDWYCIAISKFTSYFHVFLC